MESDIVRSCLIFDELFSEEKLKSSVVVNFKHKDTQDDLFKKKPESESTTLCICGNIFASKSKFDIHFASVHSHISSEQEYELIKDKTIIPISKLSCCVCDEKFSSEECRIDHIKSVHEDIELENCDSCKAAFLNTEELAKHKLFDHRYCMVCKMSFSKYPKKHFLNVHDGKMPTNRCHLCKDIFFDVDTYKEHAKLNHSFQCGHCNARFVKNEQMWRHSAQIHYNMVGNR